MSTLTTNYSFIKPSVNDAVDANIWGNELNTDLDSLDTIIKNISDVADTAAAGSPEPGDICWSWLSTKTGWVIAQGTIGNAASTATNRANADTVNLFTVLWNNLADAQAAVSGGRGVSAAADYAANKTIAVPDGRGRTLAGRDDMGGTLASRITNAIAGFVGTVLGAFGGDQNVQTHNHTVTDPTHFHTARMSNNVGGNADSFTANTGGSGGNNVSSNGSGVINTSSSATGISLAAFGAGASQNVQPTLIANMFYKL